MSGSSGIAGYEISRFLINRFGERATMVGLGVLFLVIAVGSLGLRARCCTGTLKFEAVNIRLTGVASNRGGVTIILRTVDGESFLLGGDMYRGTFVTGGWWGRDELMAKLRQSMSATIWTMPGKTNVRGLEAGGLRLIDPEIGY